MRCYSEFRLFHRHIIIYHSYPSTNCRRNPLWLFLDRLRFFRSDHTSPAGAPRADRMCGRRWALSISAVDHVVLGFPMETEEGRKRKKAVYGEVMSVSKGRERHTVVPFRPMLLLALPPAPSPA